MSKSRLLALPLIALAWLGSAGAPAAGTRSSDDAIIKAVLAADSPAPSTISNRSPLWALSERLPALPLASGDGIATTASSAVQLMQAGNGIYFGNREAREDWPGLIRRFKSDPSVANWVNATERTRIDAWIGRNFERDDLIGGWTLAYVGANGIPLTWSPTAPEPADDSSAGDFKSVWRAWVACGRGYNIAQTRAAARLYRLTGEAKYGEWAARQLDFYAGNYARWPQRTREGRSSMLAQGLDEAMAAFDLIDAARLLQDYAGPQRYDSWRDKLFMPMAGNLKLTAAPMSNIQLWHQAAIAAIAMRYGDTALLDEAQNGPQGIKAIMAHCLQADNFWIEGTFSYNAFVVQALGGLLVQAGVEGYGSRFGELRDQAGRMLLVTIDYRFDDNSLPNPNDSIGAQEVANKRVHWNLFRVAPTYWGLQLAREWRNWDSLLDPPPTIPSTPPTLPTAKTRNFPTVRQAVLRAGNWQAFVHYGQVNGNHVSDELTTFELHDGLTTIARDPGTVNYASPYHKEYFQRGAANNVPLVDGNGQTLWAPGTLQVFDAAQDLLTVEQPRYQADASVTRSYRLTGQGFVERTDITVPSRARKRLGVVFNTRCTVNLADGATPAPGFEPLPDVPAIKKYWSNTRMWQAGSDWTATLRCGQSQYTVTVRGPASQRIYLSTAPDTPLPATRTALYYDTDASQATFEMEIKARPGS